jgi:hypothetical protein
MDKLYGARPPVAEIVARMGRYGAEREATALVLERHLLGVAECPFIS